MKKPDVNLSFGLKGRFKLDVYKSDDAGNPTELKSTTGWFDNLITDTGLEGIGSTPTSNNNIQACVVGSGNTPPTVTDSSLVNFVALTNTKQANWTGVGQFTTMPYYITYSTTYSFGTGAAAGNLSEVGLTCRPTSSSGTTPLWSRALILDGNGDPTTITVLSDEVLYVTYQLIVYLPNGGADITGTFTQTILGTPTTFNYTIKPWALNQIFTATGGWFVDRISGTAAPALTAAYSAVSNGDFVAITSNSKSGTPTSYFNTTANLPYTAGSKYLEATASFNLNTGNQTWNMYWLQWAGHCSFQMKITPSITKDSTQVYSFNVRTSWARHT